MKNIVILLSFLLLSGCATGTVKYVNQYPIMPTFAAPENVPLGQVTYDFPRNKDGTIDKNSNLFIGMSTSSFQALMDNQNILKAREEKWQLILQQINKNIKNWQELNNKK